MQDNIIVFNQQKKRRTITSITLVLKVTIIQGNVRLEKNCLPVFCPGPLRIQGNRLN